VDGNWLFMLAVVGAVLLGTLLLLAALGILVQAVAVAVNLFAWAAQHGFVGIALYVILWVVATPVMIVICLVGGVIVTLAEWSGASADDPPKPGSREYLDWANRRGKWADGQPDRER
jgi:hypothetical protein